MHSFMSSRERKLFQSKFFQHANCKEERDEGRSLLNKKCVSQPWYAGTYLGPDSRELKQHATKALIYSHSNRIFHSTKKYFLKLEHWHDFFFFFKCMMVQLCVDAIIFCLGLAPIPCREGVRVKWHQQELARVTAGCWVHGVHYTILLWYKFKISIMRS